MIGSYPNLPWHIEAIYQLPCINEIIKSSNNDFPLNFHQISFNIHLTDETILLHPTKWKFSLLSSIVSEKILTLLPDENYNPRLLAENKKISIPFLLSTKLSINIVDITTRIIQEPDPISILYKYPNKPYDYDTLSSVHFISPFVRRFSYKNWNYEKLSANPTLDFNLIILFPLKPWCYDLLSKNPSIDLKIVDRLKSKNWNFDDISQNKLYYHPSLMIYNKNAVTRREKVSKVLSALPKEIVSIINLYVFN